MQSLSAWIFDWTPLRFFVESLWRDEAFTYFMSILPFKEILIKTAQDFNPPFYYFFMHIWIALLGKSEIALRTPSLIAYGVALFVIDLILKEVLLFSPRERLVSFFLLLVTPATLYFAFEARMYSLLACLTGISTYGFFTKKPKIYFISTMLALYTHYFFVFIFCLQALMILRHKTYHVLAKSFAFAAIAFSPWLLYVLPKILRSSSSFWIPRMNLFQLFLLPFSLLTGYDTFWHYYDRYRVFAGLAVLILILLCAILSTKKKEKVVGMKSYLFCWGLMIPFSIALVSFIKPIFVVRYVLFSTYGVIIFLLYCIHQGVSSRNVQLVVLVTAFMALLHFDYYMIQFRQRNEAKMYMKILDTSLRAKDTIVLSDATSYFLVRYYIPHAVVKISSPENSVPQYVGKVLIPRSAYEYREPVFPNKSFHIDSRKVYINSVF